MLYYLGSKFDFLWYLFLGVFSVVYDFKVEWVIIKGIFDYVDGIVFLIEYWKFFVSVMVVFVVSYMFCVFVVFDDWFYY